MMQNVYGMAVNARRKARIRMTKPIGNDLKIRAREQVEAGGAVAERVEIDSLEAGAL